LLAAVFYVASPLPAILGARAFWTIPQVRTLFGRSTRLKRCGRKVQRKHDRKHDYEKFQWHLAAPSLNRVELLHTRMTDKGKSGLRTLARFCGMIWWGWTRNPVSFCGRIR
jgi:hypothetical protein